jgi:Cadherin-like beta sandwich domain/GEVED domain
MNTPLVYIAAAVVGIVFAVPAEAQEDWGDAPDATEDVGIDDYITKAPHGPRHKLSAALYLGAVAGDAEPDGAQDTNATGDDLSNLDDEDAVLSSLVFIAGAATEVHLRYFNNTGSDATLAVWVDWNRNGVFADNASERVTVVVPSKAFLQDQWVALPAIPAEAANVPTGVVASFLRVRLCSDPSSVEKSTGPAEDGEVEDHRVLIYDNRDFGDLPDPGPGTGPGNYVTSEMEGGPYHRVGNALRIGALVDAELQAQPSIDATGDDLNMQDDDDGVVIPTLVAGQAGEVLVSVTNQTTQKAYLHCYIDWNNNGNFQDSGELIIEEVLAGANNGQVSLNFTVPLDAHGASPIGARFRISTLETISSTAGAPDGEVEDYFIQVIQLDFGDLPDTSAGIGPKDYQTLLANNGARHIIVPGLAITNDTVAPDADIDADADGQPNAEATGDDADGNDDDLRLYTSVIRQNEVAGPQGQFQGTLEVHFSQAVTNTTGAPATLYLFADANGDGDFDDMGEQASVVVPDGQVDEEVGITTTFAIEQMKPGVNELYLRFRLTSGANPGPNGLAPDGEVCDYLMNVAVDVPVDNFDLGSLPDPSPGIGPGDYQTTLAHGGASHWRHPGLRLGSQNSLDIVNPDSSGVTLPPLIERGRTSYLEVSCGSSISAGYLDVFVDWDNDGSFDRPSERVIMFPNQMPGQQIVIVPLFVPNDAVIGVPLGMRVRISQIYRIGANGHGGYGEVEDFLITVTDPDAPSTVSNLARLVLSAGAATPEFAVGTTSYTLAVANGVTNTTVSPTVIDETATVTVNGVTVPSGGESPSIPLSVGINTITVEVTAQDGVTTSTYTITVTRAPSSVATLKALTLSAGPLNTAFSPETRAYTVTVENKVKATTVAPKLAHSKAILKVNGVLITSDHSLAPIPLVVGINTIKIEVTAQNGRTMRTYTVKVIRKPSSNAWLEKLVVEDNNVSPKFVKNRMGYRVIVPASQKSIQIAATAAHPEAKIRIDGKKVGSGKFSKPIVLNLTRTTITVAVTAEDGSKKTYKITAARP